MLNIQSTNTRDRRWLMIEVCREFQRGKCVREADECRYAHPPPHVGIENGHVTACFDSLKDQCTRDSCKYLHPPKLVKEELQASSRAFSQTQTALQQLCNPLMLQQQAALMGSQNMISPWGFMIPQVMPLSMSFTPTAVMIPEVPCSGGRRKDKSDKLEVCREYQRSQCPRGNDECKYAHPEPHIHPDPADNMVTVCMDFMKERCERESCRYFHPPPHLQARVKANQLNASSLMAAAAQSQAIALGGGGAGGAGGGAVNGSPLPTGSPASSSSGILVPPPITSTTPSAAAAPFTSPANTYYNNPALNPNPALPQLTSFNPMYAAAAFNGLSGLGGLAGSQGFPGQGMFGSGAIPAPPGPGFMSAAAAGAGPGLYDPTLSAMGTLTLPKDPLARSTMLAQMAAEKAMLTSRKRKLMDTMSGYPEMVKRQALGGIGGAGPGGLMSPWNVTQQLALQGAISAQAGVGQPLQLANQALINPATAALMHQQAALGYTTYAIPASTSYAIPATPYSSTQQTVAQTAAVTPTQ